jgi:integrase
MRTQPSWGPTELRTFLDVIGDDRLHALYLVIGITGMRPSEALGLKWSDVDLDTGTVYVPLLPGHVDRYLVGEPYAATRRRRVDLYPGIADLLRWHGCRQRLQRLSATAWSDTDLVFTETDGSALSPPSVARHFDYLVAGVDLPIIRLDDLCRSADGESQADIVI